MYCFAALYLLMVLTILTRYPSLKNVRELLYKHGHGSVNGRRTPLTSNADIEKVLGMFRKLCGIYFCSCELWHLTSVQIRSLWHGNINNKDIARQGCTMVPRWRFFASCIFREPCAARFRAAS